MDYLEKEHANTLASNEDIEMLTGLDEAQILSFLESSLGVAPDEEAQGSVFTVITLVAMC